MQMEARYVYEKNIQSKNSCNKKIYIFYLNNIYIYI